MNRITISSIVFLLAQGFSLAQARLPLAGELSETEARRHMEILASDAMMGRNTPSPELDSAARYIASEFARNGLERLGGSYLLPYHLQRVFLGARNFLRITEKGGSQEFLVKDDFIPFDVTGAANISSAELVFAGYGISAPEFSYDDYAGLDAKGRIVVVLRNEPVSGADSVFFKGLSQTSHSWINTKVKNAAAHGAIGIIIFNDPMSYQRIRPVGFPWPSLYPNIPRESVPLRVASPGESLIPAVHGGERLVERLFGSVDNLRRLQEGIDSSRKPLSYRIAGLSADLTVSTEPEFIRVNNVAAMLKGRTKPDEYLVIGAHYDHVGFRKDAVAGTDSIYNGADDNASGTTGLLLAAEAFSKLAVRPERSIIFVAFSGEEKGLFGSRAFVDSCPVPTEKIVAMMNMDMIGRNHPDSLSIGGNTRSPRFAEINAAENATLARPFTLSYNIENFFFRSDQANFARRHIPVLFYFTGEHADYHKVGDEIAKINFPKLLGVTRLCMQTAWQVANLPDRLPYIKQAGEE